MNDLWHNEDETAKVGFALHITLLMAFDGLRSIVERFGPDHIAGDGNGCIYAVEKVPGVLAPVCIVGQYFSDLGILRTLTLPSESDLLGHNGGNLTTGEETSTGSGVCNLAGLGSGLREHLESNHGVTFEDNAWRFLMEAQGQQDSGETWGRAVEFGAKYLWDNGYVEHHDDRAYADRVYAALEASV